MSWWDEVAGEVGLPMGGEVFYFHPIGLMSIFSADNVDNSLKWLSVPYGQLTFDVEGNDIEDKSHALYRYFSRVVHWPGGASGVTIGQGYDLGQRPEPEIDLVTAGISEPLLGWLIGAKGLKGMEAKNYMDRASSEIKNITISRKQQHDLFFAHIRIYGE
ncbi:pesticin C-terminus-like muramidase [Pseudomonas sp. ok602]|uniref:pesticin C-terminus-like muramidase n=1 Tax=Pseudomonas sp. ok602 TaxID=1761898 RepID=UPI0011138F08|nr:pesticin C-terminus-like muramidase [Pseudomonas sp. ok602]